MSLRWDEEIKADKIYLPADNEVDDNAFEGVPIDQEIQNYIKREFPFPTDGETLCYSIPKEFVEHGEEQACKAEKTSWERLNELHLPKNIKSECSVNDSLWQSCFQGVCYAGRSYRNTRDGKFMSREHDIVVFNIYKGKYYVSLIEVKSTCDNAELGHVSDSTSIKNNKRSGQHQLRDHLEILGHTEKIPKDKINCFLFWPFLSMMTKDPTGGKIKRWEKEFDQHVFTETLLNPENFNIWFYKNVLGGKCIEKEHFDTLLKRFIVLSCGTFVNEVHKDMLALLSQEQTTLMHVKPSNDGTATVVHGAAGTGKTLLVLRKLEYLHERGMLNEKNKALYICYWQGIRTELIKKLEKLKIEQFVDTAIFCITRDGFLKYNKKKYRHIFMDECEAICLAFREEIVINTFKNIERSRLNDYDEDYWHAEKNSFENDENSLVNNNDTVEKPSKIYGDLWYLVDINQATIVVPKYAPNMLKKPNITLSRVMRNTRMIYKVFSQFYKNPTPQAPANSNVSHFYLSNIDVGHNICGPPIYWVDSNKFKDDPTSDDVISNRTFNALISVIVDLYSAKGIKPHDLCVLPFLTSEVYSCDNINKVISSVFNGYHPMAITQVEDFVSTTDQNKFLVTWVLRVKGLEFKVVIIVIEGDEDFNHLDTEDRRKVYIMASRCTCLLILVSTESVKDTIDVYKVMKAYPFNVRL